MGCGLLAADQRGHWSLADIKQRQKVLLCCINVLLLSCTHSRLKQSYARVPAITGRDFTIIFSERERSRSLYVIARPSVCRLSVTFVHPSQEIEIFRNVSTPFGIRWPSVNGGAENARPENAGPENSGAMMSSLSNQNAVLENAGLEIAGLENVGHGIQI